MPSSCLHESGQIIGELDFKEVAAEWEVIDAVLEPYLGTTPDEPDQVVEEEEEQIVFRTAIIGGPPRKIKKTANKISGVEFTLDGSGVVSVLESEDINLKDPAATSHDLMSLKGSKSEGKSPYFR